MKPYTVIGFFAVGDQPWMEWTEAASAAEAVEPAVRNVMKINDLDDDDGIMVVEVIEGHVKGCLCNEYILEGSTK